MIFCAIFTRKKLKLILQNHESVNFNGNIEQKMTFFNIFAKSVLLAYYKKLKNCCANHTKMIKKF